ncbi:MAG: hypothetical protein BWK75_03435 [Candidatus Altiarchaeales archaeon A3]|nr:MAG: hypothetical protein BWK75_03435 [Candidatus Altiarchaeales archaeon A3]
MVNDIKVEENQGEENKTIVKFNPTMDKSIKTHLNENITYTCNICNKVIFKCDNCSYYFSGDELIYCSKDKHFCSNCHNSIITENLKNLKKYKSKQK